MRALTTGSGAIAQLGERYNGIVEVGSSILPGSTIDRQVMALMLRTSLVLFIVGLVGLMLAGCEARTEPTAADQSVRPARVVQATTWDRHSRYEFVARLEAAQTVDLAFEVDGVLAQLPVREGQSLAAGTLLAALEPRDLELAVAVSEAELQLADQDLARKRTLLARGAIGASAVDDAEARQRLHRARLALERENLAKSRLFAPFDAYVARRYVDNFVRVDKADNILRLIDLHELLVVANIPERLFALFDADQSARLEAEFPVAPGRRFPLVFRENRGEAEAVSQTYEVSLAMPRPGDVNLLPGMTGALHVTVLSGTDQPPLVVIPPEALVIDAHGDFFVWRVDLASGQIARQPVVVDLPDARRGVPVLSGLSGGEDLVAAGASQLQDGMRVRPLASGAGPAP